MARTSKGSTPAAANVQALDNLNLDDMFDEGGDDLFDGLDIDLGNMDDITGSGGRLTADSIAEPLPIPGEEPASPEGSSPQPRKTKRKPKAPLMYEDNDDDLAAEPPKKKRKGAKSATKGKTDGIAMNDNSIRSSQVGTKVKKGKGSSSAPGATVRTGSAESTVAAAGQFGRRTGSFTLPKVKSKPPARPDPKSKMSSPSHGGVQDTANVASATLSALRQVLASHPALKPNTSCGLSPSSTVFYPFLPSLPSELAMKSRKVYVFLEKIQSAFVSMHGKGSTDTVNAALESDAIFKLVQEAFREPAQSSDAATMDTTSGRADIVGNAIGAIRQTVASFDKTKFAGDLYAMCELLKRQHDFLKQNLDNMEKWCKNNFAKEDYASVYLPPKSKKRKASEISDETILRSFKKRLLKVRVTCVGFRESKTTTLQAVLPIQFGPVGQEAPTNTSSPKSKKKKAANETTKPVKSGSGLPVVNEKTLPYADCKPLKRRKLVADILSCTARELEMRFQRRIDDRDQLVRRQETELKKVVDEDEIPIVHSAGMWRWVEKSGLFAPFTHKDVVDRLSVLTQQPLSSEKSSQRTPLSERSDIKIQSSMDRLSSLLVEENISDDEGNDFEPEYSSDDEFTNNEPSLDISSLSFAERSLIHLEMLGLRATSGSLSTRTHFLSPDAECDNLKGEPDCDVESVILQMTADLNNLESMNVRRAAFLESLALSADNLSEGMKRRRDEEAAMITKCQQLLKKNREHKLKPAKAKAAQDDLALPW
ncbi:hypothetical protein FisN_4Lh052 [Fistulifera solaris]|uniref:Uncharacterized protein n=1 Tax=Fistulifera solaris TaxID=1519565 RepID=A0A1Z5KDE8_FISSO|nr:hypothetical protein FisN_4Lh052 [Fistulifera solaris]|eukprot:GAX24247.1 hypothetical protein FisN_4Lh052 [Fistulifera solaris]